MEAYKGWTIFEKDGRFTVGGDHNVEFSDCTFENLVPAVVESEMVAWCLNNGIHIEFNDLRGLRNNPSYEDYLNHLERYDCNPDWGFVDFELIVPTAIFNSIEQAKGFLDWLDEQKNNKLHIIDINASLEDQIQSASSRATASQSSDKSQVRASTAER